MKIKFTSAKEWLMALMITACLLLGCSSPSSSLIDDVDRLEVYYRTYDSLSPVQYSEKELIRSASFKTAVTDRASIARVAEKTTLKCKVEQTLAQDRMDLHLLIREYSKTKLVRSWMASRFHFSQTPGGWVCKLRREDRNGIEAVITELRQSSGA